MDAPFEKLSGIKEVISGYSGGIVNNPTFDQIHSGNTGYAESIQVIYDPRIISYSELVDVYWKQFNPTDDGGSFLYRGSENINLIFFIETIVKRKLPKHPKRTLINQGYLRIPSQRRLKSLQYSFLPGPISSIFTNKTLRDITATVQDPEGTILLWQFGETKV